MKKSQADQIEHQERTKLPKKPALITIQSAQHHARSRSPESAVTMPESLVTINGIRTGTLSGAIGGFVESSKEESVEKLKLTAKLKRSASHFKRNIAPLLTHDQLVDISANWYALDRVQKKSDTDQIRFLKQFKADQINFASVARDSREALAFARHILESLPSLLTKSRNAGLAAKASELARKNANKRHAPGKIARDFVVKEWAKHSAEYAGNKSAFARDYVKRVLNEFEVRLTEKQMREIWLKDTPSAGKQAG